MVAGQPVVSRLRMLGPTRHYLMGYQTDLGNDVAHSTRCDRVAKKQSDALNSRLALRID